MAPCQTEIVCLDGGLSWCKQSRDKGGFLAKTLTQAKPIPPATWAKSESMVYHTYSPYPREGGFNWNITKV